MGLALAAMVGVLTILLCMIIIMANGMSDAPSEDGTAILVPFVIGMTLTALLAISHFFPISMVW